MAANGNDTGDDDTAAAVGSCISSDIIHRLQDLTVGTSTSNPTQVGALSSQRPPALLPPAPPPVNNAVDVATTATPSRWPPPANNAASRRSKGWDSSKIMAARLGRLRRRRLFEGRLPPPSVASVTDELQNLMVGAAAFRPTAHELVGRFLRPRLSGGGGPLPRAARFIHDADVYAATPDHLAATHAPAPAASAAKLTWYFFSPLRFQPDRWLGRIPCRRVIGGGGGIWKSTAGRWKLAEEGEAANWYATNLAYCDGHELGLTEWRMREHGIAKDGGWQQTLVLCELFRSP